MSVWVASSQCARADAQQEAHRHYEAGVVACEQLRFADAADAFEQAYAKAPAWQVLYNLGTVYAALGRTAEAISALTRYLEQADSSVSPERRQDVQHEIENQRAKSSSEHEVRVGEPRAPARELPEPKTSVDGQPAKGDIHRIAGISLGAAGLLAVAVGGVLAADGQGKHNDAVELAYADQWSKAIPLEAEADDQKRIGFVTMGIGGALAIAGAALWLLAPEAESEVSMLRVSGFASTASAGVLLHRSW